MASVTKTTLKWVLEDDVSGKVKGIGASLGNLVNPMNLAIAGAVGLGAALVGAVKSAAEEQINIEKLNTSLAANVVGFNGNTDAIEELISKRELLGFSDDEQRASLAMLVAGTKDVTEAQNLQSLAMDLARLKGVDLETATTAVAKANAGSTRELKALGLEIDDNATAAENLAVIQAAAAGQAAAYGDTLAGKWDAVQIKFADVMEDIGAGLIGPMSDLADFVLEDLIPGVEHLAAAIGPGMTKAFDEMGRGVATILRVLQPLLDKIEEIDGAALSLGAALGVVGGIISPGGTMAGVLSQPAPTLVTVGGRAVRPGTGTTGTGGGRASGGDVDPWGTYTVGEQGPEMLVMGSQGGSIIPGGGGGAPVVIPVIIDGREIARIIDEHLYYDVQRASPIQGRA